MKTKLTQIAINTVVHLGYIPEKAWWGTDGDGNGKDHLFITLKNDGHPSEIARLMAKGAVAAETGLDEDHVHVS